MTGTSGKISPEKNNEYAKAVLFGMVEYDLSFAESLAHVVKHHHFKKDQIAPVVQSMNNLIGSEKSIDVLVILKKDKPDGVLEYTLSPIYRRDVVLGKMLVNPSEESNFSPERFEDVANLFGTPIFWQHQTSINEVEVVYALGKRVLGPQS